MFELIAETEQRARKQHHCCECETSIAIGEKYTRTVCLIDGEFTTNKSHTDCLAVGVAMFDELYFDGNMRNLVLAGMGECRETIDVILKETKENYPSVFNRLCQHKFVATARDKGVV